MADEDKQFEASQQKLEKARKEGSVVKSKDFSTAVSLLVVFIGIFNLAPFIWDQITRLFTLLYQQIPNAHIETIGLSYISCRNSTSSNYWTSAFSCVVYGNNY